MLASCWH